MSEISALFNSIGAMAAGVALCGIVIIVIFILCRRPDTFFRLRRGDTEFEYNPRPKPLPESGEQSALPPPREPEDSSNEIEEIRKERADVPESLFTQATTLLRQGEYTEGMKLLEEDLQAEPQRDPETRVSIIAFGQHMAAENGSTKALNDLRKTAEENPGVSDTHLFLGIALRQLGMHEEANKAFSRAYETARTDLDKATALNWRWQGPSSVEKLLDASKRLNDQRAKSRLYVAAAKRLLDANPPDLGRAFAFYEHALILDPSNNSLRFDVAYAYEEKGSHAAAMWHYKELVRRDARRGDALNNLAVSASNLGLESIAVEHYERAEEFGNTLATANLARKLIDGGFVDEARGRLEGKVHDPGVHEDVFEALGRVATSRKEDEANEKTLMEKSRKVRNLLASWGKGIASGTTLTEEASGTYREGITTLRLEISMPGSVSGTLTSALQTWDLSGAIVGPGMTISWYEHRADSTDWLFRRTGYGFFILTDNRVEGFTYEGAWRPDPSAETSYQEYRLQRLDG